MGQDLDPPRGIYKLGPRTFERVNEPTRAAAGVGTPPAGSAKFETAPETPPDMNCIDRKAADGLPPGDPDSRRNDVYQILRSNLETDLKGGWYRVEPGIDVKRRRRTRLYWLTLAAVDVPLTAIAWLSGPGEPFAFACAIGGIGYFTGRLTWETWFLRTD
jgi:hypothetical protein